MCQGYSGDQGTAHSLGAKTLIEDPMHRYLSAVVREMTGEFNGRTWYLSANYMPGTALGVSHTFTHFILTTPG